MIFTKKKKKKKKSLRTAKNVPTKLDYHEMHAKVGRNGNNVVYTRIVFELIPTVDITANTHKKR